MSMPPQMTELPEYDSANLLHVARWIQAGRPSDPEWRPEIVYYLQVDGTTYLPASLPDLITETPEYDSGNPLHLAKWEAAKRPDVNAIDGDGNRWRPSVATRLVDGQYITESVPDSTPVTDVEIMTGVFIDYRGQATLLLDGLKGQVWSYLKNEQKMDPAQATAAGVAFCMSEGGIGVQYGDFIKAGGHPVAATALWNRIQAVKGDFIWFDSGVEAVFATALGQA